ncbi:hypothetical protein GGI35DRAFT_399056 [Trichoderma velutinum]
MATTCIRRSGDKAWVHSERNALERLHLQRPRFACVTSFGRATESDKADKPETGKLVLAPRSAQLAWTWYHWPLPLLRILRFGLFWGTLTLLRSHLFRRCDGSPRSSSSSSRQAQWPLICHFTPPTWTLALERAAAGMRADSERERSPEEG